jgi:prolyl oligopeptidase
VSALAFFSFPSRFLAHNPSSSSRGHNPSTSSRGVAALLDADVALPRAASPLAKGNNSSSGTKAAAAAMGSVQNHDEEFNHLPYPKPRRDESVKDVYHGVEIADPYRSLENPDSPETKEYVAAEVELCDSVLAGCPNRETLKEEITALFNYPRYGCPFKVGDKYHYSHNSGLQAQSVLFIQDSVDGEAAVLLDANSLSEDGTVALSTKSFSENAEHLAYGLSSSGSDWVTINVMRVADRVVLPDTLSWVKFTSIAWTYDHKGFFYNRYPQPKNVEGTDAGTETDINLYHELCYHFLGTGQSDDILCWKDLEHAAWTSSARVTDDGQYLVLSIGEGCDPVNRLYYFDLTTLVGGLVSLTDTDSMLDFVKLVDNFDAQYQYVANDGPVFTFITNKNAPKYKITRVDINKPDVWTDVVPESESDVLHSATCVNENQLLLCYISDVKHTLQVHDLETGAFHWRLPLEIGTVTDISGKREDCEIFFNFTSFLIPGTVYRCDLGAPKLELKVLHEVDFDHSRFETKQVFVPSKDGTKIPMFIVSEKGLVHDGKHPALLYGYGGFNISLTPTFSVSRLVLARHYGAVVAVANIRGGGEYGEEWHKAGSLLKKQNCFDDFISCSEYLINEGYTQSSKLCIEGGSNGGLLVAACINQRPELFGCALAHVGVMDMLRFHKFTIGHAWTSDYGCSDKEEDFHNLIKFSPLHNVRRPWDKILGVQYPPTMLLTADHDDRVVPLHSLKLLATLQHELCTSLPNSPQTNPIIARIDKKAGHGAGRSTQKMIDEVSDAYAFFAKMTEAVWVD